MTFDEAMEQVTSRTESRDRYDGEDNDPACLGRHFWTADLQAMEVLAEQCKFLAGQAITANGEAARLRAELAACEKVYETHTNQLRAENAELRAWQENNKHGVDLSGNGVLYGSELACRMAMEQRQELEWFRRRKELSDELQSVYAALTDSKHEAIVEATAKLFDFDVAQAAKKLRCALGAGE